MRVLPKKNARLLVVRMLPWLLTSQVDSEGHECEEVSHVREGEAAEVDQNAVVQHPQSCPGQRLNLEHNSLTFMKFQGFSYFSIVEG